jgi:hypothetical protein
LCLREREKEREVYQRERERELEKDIMSAFVKEILSGKVKKWISFQ